MKRILLICLLCVFSIPQFGFAQEEEEKGRFWDRVYGGGNFGIGIGNHLSYIDISPLAGYWFNEDFSVGAGITYQYLKYRQIDLGYSIYGGRTFARHRVFNNIFGHLEYEQLNTYYLSLDQLSLERGWVPGLMLGGSIFQSFGRRGGINFTALYNILYDNRRSPYNSPVVIRLGFMI